MDDHTQSKGLIVINLIIDQLFKGSSFTFEHDMQEKVYKVSDKKGLP